MTTLTPLASTLVTQLGLAPHPEGGHFRRTWTAPTHVETPRGQRATASAILFVLDRDEEAACTWCTLMSCGFGRVRERWRFTWVEMARPQVPSRRS